MGELLAIGRRARPSTIIARTDGGRPSAFIARHKCSARYSLREPTALGFFSSGFLRYSRENHDSGARAVRRLQYRYGDALGEDAR